MTRRLFIVLVFGWGFLALCALLAYAGVMNPIGFYTHVVPATFILERLGPAGEVLLSDRPFVGSGHGPPHLGLLGMALIYLLPLVVAVLLVRQAAKLKDGRA